MRCCELTGLRAACGFAAEHSEVAMNTCSSIVVVFAFLALSVPAFADSLPAGPYKDSCTNCEAKDGTLKCACGKAIAGSRHSSLKYTTCAATPISNRDGHLRCDGVLKMLGSDELPKGSYRNKCHSCMLKEGKLACLCWPRVGGEVRGTSLNYTLGGRCTLVGANDDGVLGCER